MRKYGNEPSKFEFVAPKIINMGKLGDKLIEIDGP
jgi:hypothetical protein